MEASPTPGAAQNGPNRLAADVLEFARDKLGPASERLFADPANQVLVLSRVRNGFDLEDAVLAEAHRTAAGNARVADEFLAYFLGDLMKVGHKVRSSALQRFLDTGDLVQSVVGDLWPDLQSVRFETRGRFLSYLGRRLGWKASDKSRALSAGNRREDRRVDAQPEELDHEADDELSPLLEAARREDRERLAVLMLRLPDRDREMLALLLKGKASNEIAEEVGISPDAARVALQRAVRKLKKYR